MGWFYLFHTMLYNALINLLGSTNSCCDVVQMQSSGPAGDSSKQGETMGYYYKSSVTFNYRPVYVHQDGELTMYFAGNWLVWFYLS